MSAFSLLNSTDSSRKAGAEGTKRGAERAGASVGSVQLGECILTRCHEPRAGLQLLVAPSLAGAPHPLHTRSCSADTRAAESESGAQYPATGTSHHSALLFRRINEVGSASAKSE